VLAAVRVPRAVASHVPLQLLLRLGPVRALGAGKRPVAVAGDPVLLELRLVAEAGAAHATLFAVGTAVRLAMQRQLKLCHAARLAVAAREPVGVLRVHLSLVRLKPALGVVGAAAHSARIVLLPEVQLLVEAEVALDRELLSARLAPKLLDADVRLEVPCQLLRRTKRDVAIGAEVVALVHLAAVRVPCPTRVKTRVAERARVRSDHGHRDGVRRCDDRRRLIICRRVGNCACDGVDNDCVVLLRVRLLPVRRQFPGLMEARPACLAAERLYLQRGVLRLEKVERRRRRVRVVEQDCGGGRGLDGVVDYSLGVDGIAVVVVSAEKALELMEAEVEVGVPRRRRLLMAARKVKVI
jgi:hypothetical protein